MNAMDFGHAIFGLDAMLKGASAVLYGDETRVRLQVDADLSRGSFDFLCHIVGASSDLIRGLDLEQLREIVTLLGLCAHESDKHGNVIDLCRWIAGRTIERVTQVSGLINISLKDGDVISVNKRVYNVASNNDVREGIRGVLKPLENDDVTDLESRPEEMAPQRIHREERPYIVPPALPGRSIVDNSIATVKVLSVSCVRGNKWRVKHGESSIFVDILDEAFLDRFEANEELFAPDHYLRVRLRVVTDPISDNAAHQIIEVLEHFQPPYDTGQTDLFRSTDHEM